MNNERVEIEYSVDRLGWKLVRIRRGYDGRIEYLTGEGWKTKEPGQQVLFDESMIWEDIMPLYEAVVEQLTKMGRIKPDPTAGKLEATERHLEDMRTLALKRGKTK